MEESNFEEFEDIVITRRRNLLPWWIKFFCWFFMSLGVAACLSTISLLFGQIPQLAFYGFDAQDFFPFFLLLLLPVFIMKGITGYLLWFEKDNAINAGKLCVYIGIGLCIISTVWHMVSDGELTFRLEVIALVLFSRKLNAIEYNWG